MDANKSFWDKFKVHWRAITSMAGELGTALDPYLDAIADEMAVLCQGKKTGPHEGKLGLEQACRAIRSHGL